MEISHLVELIKDLNPELKCKYVRGDEFCTYVGIEESEPRVNSLTPSGDSHSIAGSYLEKLADRITPYEPFNISQLMNNSGSNRPIIETILAHTSEFYWVQVAQARYVVWTPNHKHEPGQLIEWKDRSQLKDLKKQFEIKHAEHHHISYGGNNQYVSLLLKKYNLILTGAPGTGKTYTAKAIAASIISDGKSGWYGLSDEQKQQCAFVQFHPSYDYTDFVEGLRPNQDGTFSRQDGIFKEFCKRALGEEDIVSSVSDNLFDKVYSDLVDAIRNGEITKYERITAADAGITINEKGRIVYKPEDPHSRKESIRNMRLLFDYYFSNGKVKIERDDRDEMYAIISRLTDGKTNGLDFTEYMWTLNQLLNRATSTHDLAYRASMMENSPEKDKIEQSKTPYIFIIDEINRGELSKIFGELFYSIEPDYRGPVGTVQTQYNNMVENDDVFKSGFYIPENVYIIGTMNDVDRGVEAMDFAIRRRFAWQEVTAEDSAVNMGITGLAKAKMESLNKALVENGLTKAHCIGGAYFRKLEGNDFDSLWKYHLAGIVYEYFRGEPDIEEKLNAVKKAYDEAELPVPAEPSEAVNATESDSEE